MVTQGAADLSRDSGGHERPRHCHGHRDGTVGNRSVSRIANDTIGGRARGAALMSPVRSPRDVCCNPPKGGPGSPIVTVVVGGRTTHRKSVSPTPRNLSCLFLRFLVLHEVPRAAQIVASAEVQFQQQMFQCRHPRRHLRQHNVDPLRQLVQTAGEPGCTVPSRSPLLRPASRSASCDFPMVFLLR